MKIEYSRDYRVRAYEVDINGKLAPHQICNYLQDISELHARQLGLSTGQLPSHLTWMLTGLRWTLSSRPEWRDTIRLDTWPSGVDRLYAYRDFKGYDSDGRVWMNGTSRWILLDITRKRPVRMPDEVKNLRVPTSDSKTDSFEKIEPSGIEVSTRHFTVRGSDVDILQHTNNAFYAAWITESVPDSVRSSFELRSLEIQFRSESVEGDVIMVTTLRRGNSHFSHVIRKQEGDIILALAETSWAR